MSLIYKKIFSGSPLAVIALKEALIGVNIIPIIKDIVESARLAGFGVTSNIQEVFVHPDEVEIAQQTIKEIS